MPQSVILLTDVPGLGQVGDVRNVKEGYARNYLIPQKVAVPATPNNVKRFEQQKEKIAKAREDQLGRAKTQAEKLSKVGLVYERPLGPGGKLFGSVTAIDIVADLAKEGAPIEKRSVLLDGPLKTTGEHTVRVRIHSKVIVDIPVKIIGKALTQEKSAAETKEEDADDAAETTTKEKEQEKE